MRGVLVVLTEAAVWAVTWPLRLWDDLTLDDDPWDVEWDGEW